MTKYYDHTTYPLDGSVGDPSLLRAELDLIEAGFDNVDADKANLSGALFTGEVNYRGVGSVSTNTAFGSGALSSNSTGTGNTAFGYNAGKYTGVRSYNTAFGSNAMSSGIGVIGSSAFGYSALKNMTGGNGQNNAFGYLALRDTTTGSYDCAFGTQAGYQNTTGNYLTAFGQVALSNSVTYSNVAGFGYNAQVAGDNEIQLGNSATTVYSYATATRSDIRDKADIRDTQLGLDFIKALRPVDAKWDYREDYRPPMPADLPEKPSEQQKAAHKAEMDAWNEACKFPNLVRDGSKKRTRYHHMLIAQEVKQAMDAMGVDFGGYKDNKIKGGDDVLGINYEELIAPIIKALQELDAKFEAYKAAHP